MPETRSHNLSSLIHASDSNLTEDQVLCCGFFNTTLSKDRVACLADGSCTSNDEGVDVDRSPACGKEMGLELSVLVDGLLCSVMD